MLQEHCPWIEAFRCAGNEQPRGICALGRVSPRRNFGRFCFPSSIAGAGAAVDPDQRVAAEAAAAEHNCPAPSRTRSTGRRLGSSPSESVAGRRKGRGARIHRLGRRGRLAPMDAKAEKTPLHSAVPPALGWREGSVSTQQARRPPRRFNVRKARWMSGPVPASFQRAPGGRGNGGR